MMACSADSGEPLASGQGADTTPAGGVGATGPPSQPTGSPGPDRALGDLEGESTEAAATRKDPVPSGEIARFPGLWDIRVDEVDVDATDEVLAFADINPKPELGYQYVLVTIEGVYRGDSIAQPVFEWGLIDRRNREYQPWVPGCGVIPNSIYDIVEIEAGERFSANVCMPVKARSVRRGLDLHLKVVGGDKLFFDLDRS